MIYFSLYRCGKKRQYLLFSWAFFWLSYLSEFKQPPQQLKQIRACWAVRVLTNPQQMPAWCWLQDCNSEKFAISKNDLLTNSNLQFKDKGPFVLQTFGCDSTKSTGVINNMNCGCFPWRSAFLYSKSEPVFCCWSEPRTRRWTETILNHDQRKHRGDFSPR